MNTTSENAFSSSESPKISASAKPRLIYLDGLRGFAALMVVLFHLWGGAGGPSWQVRLAPLVTLDLLSPIGALGGSRVSLFFVLSGFLLYLPFARRDATERCEQRAGASGYADEFSPPQRERPPKRETLALWLWRRFRRLAPPYYAAIPIALFPIVGTFYLNEMWRIWGRHLPPRTPVFANLLDAFPECLFFLHGMMPGSEKPAFNGPLWTLTPEVQLYVAFPLLVALAGCRRRIGRWRVGGLGMAVTLAVAASIAYRIWLYDEIGFALPLDDGAALGSDYHCLVNTFLGRWAEFALGMGAAGAVIRERVPSPRLVFPAFGLCLAGFLILRSDLAIGGFVGHLLLAMEPAPSPLADAVGGAAFALLILCCASMPRLSRLFSWRPLVTLGTFAYSLYLIHAPVLSGFHHAIEALLHGNLMTKGGNLRVFVLNLVVGLPLSLAVARLFWYVCERPFLSQDRKRVLEAPYVGANADPAVSVDERPDATLAPTLYRTER